MTSPAAPRPSEPRRTPAPPFVAPQGPDAVRLVDRLVARAFAAGASDLHLETGDDGVRVRLRVDGVMREVERLPRGAAQSLVSRLKILAGLDIADRLRPQDGRARVTVDGREHELRLSTLPAARGENVVLRLPGGDAGVPTLDALGLVPADRADVEALLDAREGLVLVTGPTGSGKTTTLHAALARLLTRGGTNVVTVEDPVERRLPGAVQVQVNERTGLTFATALRSILRQDPDVVLVGEIRDRETAAIAAQAALTGHLVLATLHTIDAASAVTRLGDVGVDGATIAAALRGVLAQRLVRRRCAACDGTGCERCAGAGYRGRVAIVEVLRSDGGLVARIAAGASATELAAAARRGGMRSLWESAVAQVRAGVTDLAEVRRVLDDPALQPGGDAGAAPRLPALALDLLELVPAQVPRVRGLRRVRPRPPDPSP